jgi:hypothetical protein
VCKLSKGNREKCAYTGDFWATLSVKIMFENSVLMMKEKKGKLNCFEKILVSDACRMALGKHAWIKQVKIGQSLTEETRR